MTKYQYFKFFLLFIAISVNNGIHCSEKAEKQKSQNNKSTAITRVLKVVAIGCPILSGVYQYTHYSSKPCGMNKYPHAQVWYDEMSEKYSVANLGSAEFCEDSLWLSSGNRIFFPSYHLQVINSIYSKRANNQTLGASQICLSTSSMSDVDNRNLNMNEFLLLHEAGHRKNHDTSAVNVGLDITKKTIVTALGSMVTASSVGAGVGWVANGVDTFVGSLAKEERADKFACDHAQNIDVLMGGLQFFNYLTEQRNLARERADVDPISFARSIDPLHPDSHLRAQKVVDEIHRRRIIDNTCPVEK